MMISVIWTLLAGIMAATRHWRSSVTLRGSRSRAPHWPTMSIIRAPTRATGRLRVLLRSRKGAMAIVSDLRVTSFVCDARYFVPNATGWTLRKARWPKRWSPQSINLFLRSWSCDFLKGFVYCWSCALGVRRGVLLVLFVLLY